MSDALNPPCDCAYLSESGSWHYDCGCGNGGDMAEVAIWCDRQSARPRLPDGLREELRNAVQFGDVSELAVIGRRVLAWADEQGGER